MKTKCDTRGSRQGTRDSRSKACQDVTSTDARNMRCSLERKDQITNRDNRARISVDEEDFSIVMHRRGVLDSIRRTVVKLP